MMTPPNQMTNQSELEQMKKEYTISTDNPTFVDSIQTGYVTGYNDAIDHIVAYITANFTPNSTVEQLKSRIAWLEGKVEGLKGESV